MSYEIVYRKIVVPLKDGRVLPIVEIGSSNCYDVWYNWKERRERSRWLFTEWISDRNKIEQRVKNWIQNHIDKWELTEQDRKEWNAQRRASIRFPWWTLWSAISYLSNPNASYEQAREHLKFRLKSYNDWKTEYWERYWLDDIDILLSQEETFKRRLEVSWCDNLYYDLQQERKIQRANRLRVEKEPWKFVIKLLSWNWYWSFVYKMTSRRLQSSRYMDVSKRFYTVKTAEARAEKNLRKYLIDKWEVVDLNSNSL